jgi:multidrug efflux pump subunit AcrA (membrane-fusion protein)
LLVIGDQLVFQANVDQRYTEAVRAGDLSEGDVIVVTGQSGLRAGDKVSVSPAARYGRR